MRFPQSLVPGILIQREKRFLMHVRLASGERVVAHCVNTGSMRGVSEPGRRIWLSPAANPRRKLAWTAELIEAGDPPTLVGINTLFANRLAAEAIGRGRVRELAGHDWLRREVKATPGTRFDFLLGRGSEQAPRESTWVEVKSVTLLENRRALFPDAVSERGRKHLLALGEQVAAGHRAVLLFVVQRNDAVSCGPADAVDPAYGAALRAAMARGVTVLAHAVRVSPTALDFGRRLPLAIA